MKVAPLLVAACVGLVAAPTLGQSLSDRIANVRAQQGSSHASADGKHSLRAMLGVLLYTDINVAFDQTAARDVFAFLATRLDLNILARYSDDRNADGFGIDPDTPITLSMEDAPALAVLELALEQCSTYEQATWQMRRGYIEIGTKDRLSTPAARFVKVYPIDDLLFEPRGVGDAPSLDLAEIYRNRYLPYGLGRGVSGSGSPGGSIFNYNRTPSSNHVSKEDKAQQIVEFIMDTVEPMAWEANGGDWASIRYFDGALIVRAPDYIHRQIGGYPKPIKPATEAPSSAPASGGTP